jgi:hypothetical protein
METGKGNIFNICAAANSYSRNCKLCRSFRQMQTVTTPFFMVYRAEVVFPPEVIMGSLRVKTYDETTQDQLRCEDIDLVDERRWQAAIKNARYRQALRRYHQWFV